jgi:hypothetical protein
LPTMVALVCWALIAVGKLIISSAIATNEQDMALTVLLMELLTCSSGKVAFRSLLFAFS